MRPLRPAALAAALVGLSWTAAPAASPPRPEPLTVPLTAEAWLATDSIRFGTYLGRPSVYINRGVALARDVAMEDGVLELDLAATDTTSFLGVTFRASNPRFSNVIFFRPGQSGSEEAVQYGPAFNATGVAWQVYHSRGANAVATIQRNRWIHVRVELAGSVARLFLDRAARPTLTVSRVVTSGGSGLGVWTGAFGQGAYFSNVEYTPAPAPLPPAAPPQLSAGTITDWEISDPIAAADFMPTRLPELRRLTWQRVEVEPEGFVLVNRYREAPACGSVPRDSTGAVLVDSVMTGRMEGARVVYARTTISSPRDETRRLEYAYANGIVIYHNGRPLVLAMNPGGLRASLSKMGRVGDAVYLPLRRGRNQLVFAVIDCTGGWAFSGRLDPR